MKKYLKNIFAASLALLAFCAIGVDADCFAQSAVQTPVYVPSVAFPLGTYAATVSTSTPTAAFSVQNQATMCIQLSGTYTALTAVMQGTVSPPSVAASAAVWNTISVVSSPDDKSKITTITANGLYCFSTGAFRQVRLNVTAVTISGTNSLVISASGTTDNRYVVNTVQKKRTFTSAFSVVSPATAAVDFATLTGSATAQIRVKEVQCWGTAATSYLETVSLIKRSTLDTGSAAANPAAIPMDSSDLAATATVATYTTAPSPKGTAVGTVRLAIETLTVNGGIPAYFDWQFGVAEAQDLILNSAIENIALNSTTSSYAQTFVCALTWEEQ